MGSNEPGTLFAIMAHVKELTRLIGKDQMKHMFLGWKEKSEEKRQYHEAA